MRGSAARAAFVGAVVVAAAAVSGPRVAAAAPAKCPCPSHARVLTLRPFPSIGTTFTDVESYAENGADVRPLMTFGPRPGLQVLFDLGPLSLFRLTRPDFFDHSRVGFEVAYYHVLAIDHVGGVAGRDLRGRMIKVAAVFEVRRLVTAQIGVSAFIRVGDVVPGTLEHRVVPGIHYAMGPEFALWRWLSFTPMIKLEGAFDESFIAMVSLMLGLQFNI